MKRKKSTEESVDKKHASKVGFQKLFGSSRPKKMKKTSPEGIIDLCSQDDEIEKENNLEESIKIESSVQLDDSKEMMEISNQSVVDVALMIFNDIKTNRTKLKLIGEEFTNEIENIVSMSNLEIYDLLRWYRRSPGWKHKFKDNFELGFEKLKKYELLSELEESDAVDFENLVELLSKEELDRVATKFHVDKKYRKNMHSIKDKLMQEHANSTVSAFTGISSSARLEKAVYKELKGKRFKISDKAKDVLNSLFLVYSPTLSGINTAGSDGQVPGSASIKNWKTSTISIGQSFLQSKFNFIGCFQTISLFFYLRYLTIRNR